MEMEIELEIDLRQVMAPEALEALDLDWLAIATARASFLDADSDCVEVEGLTVVGSIDQIGAELVEVDVAALVGRTAELAIVTEYWRRWYRDPDASY